MLVGSEYELIEGAEDIDMYELVYSVFGDGPVDSKVKGGWDFGYFEHKGKKVKGGKTFMGISYYVIVPNTVESVEDATPVRRRRFDG